MKKLLTAVIAATMLIPTGALASSIRPGSIKQKTKQLFLYRIKNIKSVKTIKSYIKCYIVKLRPLIKKYCKIIITLHKVLYQSTSRIFTLNKKMYLQYLQYLHFFYYLTFIITIKLQFL